MKNIIKCCKGNILYIIAAPLLKLCEAALELLVPVIMAEIIDKGIIIQNKNYVFKNGLILIVLSVSCFVISVISQYFSAKASANTVKNLRQKAYSHILNLSHSQIDKVGASSLITRLTGDMNGIQTGINLTLRLILRSPFVVFGACFMAVRIDKNASPVFFGVLVSLCVIVFLIMFFCVPLNEKVRIALDNVLKSSKDALTGIKVIKAFCLEMKFADEFKVKNAALVKKQKVVGKISALTNPLTSLAVNSGITALIYTGALRVETGVITIGVLVALYNYLNQILVELVKLANLIITVSKSLACVKRVDFILNLSEPEYAKELPAASDDVKIEFRDVYFKYPEACEASLKNISLSLSSNEIIGVTGSTGSGKTTFVNLICGLYPVSDGTIELNGKNINEINREYLNSIISSVPQKSRLFSGTVRSNLVVSNPDADDNMMVQALKDSGCSDFILNNAKGLETPVLNGGQNFSGGQRQRLCIARVLLKKSNVFLFDDSFSALDSVTESNIRNVIKTKYKDKLIIIVSQRIPSIMQCDKILIFDEGTVQTGTHSSLLKESVAYCEMYKSQFGEENKNE
ncbi:MAG: ABC transporter ATP-binding protein/permease [Clostridiales bacterium]|nr:ABC transporter ATP-binding protein/permease [Clostridiales bacterium]